MLTAVKNQIKVLLITIKYNYMREMTNRATFLTNVSFMVLNNATFIIQWYLLFQLKENIGGYAMNEVMVIWGLSASSYGLSHIFFQNAYSLPSFIINGKLDAFLVQPKNILLSVISSGTNSSAIGDLIYGYLVIIIFRFSIKNLFLFTLLSILGAMIMTAFVTIMGSISFYIVRGDLFAENATNVMILTATYPDTIFNEAVRLLMYTVIPTGFIIYLPMKIILHFNPIYFLAVIGFTSFIVPLAFFIFHKGLKHYTSGNLMLARM